MEARQCFSKEIGRSRSKLTDRSPDGAKAKGSRSLEMSLQIYTGRPSTGNADTAKLHLRRRAKRATGV